MIGGTPLASIFGAIPDEEVLTDPERARVYARALCDAGMAVMLIHPGTKEPADMRTPQKKNADDKAAREAAREAGRADWERVRSASGLYLATNDKTVIDRYIKRWFEVHGQWEERPAASGELKANGEPKTERHFVSAPPLNLAIEVGRSNLVVVDADTKAQVDEFLRMCGAPPDLPPTVQTPGKLFNGEWVHKDGGHFYFTVDPENPLPTEIGSTVIGETSIAVLWNNRYVLIPPSVRAEGKYTATGRDYPVPSQLAELIVNRNQARLERATRVRDNGTDDELGQRIDNWARQVSWEQILAPYGWVPISAPDNCGCPMFTAPGDHASPKSATAHDAGCSLGWWDNDINAPLHIWTDNPGDPFAGWITENQLKTVTKFQAVALLEYDGDQARAMDDLGISPNMGVDIEGVNIAAIATEDADPRNLNDDTHSNLTANPESCEHERLEPSTGECHACGEQIAPPLGPRESDAAKSFGDPSREPGEPVRPPEPETAGISQHTQLGGEQVTAGDDPMPADRDYRQEFLEGESDWVNNPEPPSTAGGATPPPAGPPPADTPPAATPDPEPEDPGNQQPSFENMSLHDIAGVPPAVTGDGDGFPIVGEIDQTSGLYMPIQAGVPEMAPFRHWRDLPPPEYVVGGLLEHGGLTCIIGTPGAGKSTLSLDLACHIATGRSWQGRPVLKTKVLYLPGEGLRGVVQRLIAWEEARNTTVGEDLILGNGIIQLGATREAWAELREYVARQQIGLIIFDTFARMATNIDENSATDVGKAIKRFDQVRELTHCGVLVVHHTGKASPEIARGSSALNGALDSELLVRTENERVVIPGENGQETWGKVIHLRVTKQKNAEQDNEEIDLLMVNWHDRAPLITGPTGTIDPMQGEVLLARPTPEPLIETAVRIRLYVDRFTEQGCTRSDIAAGVVPDAFTQGLRYPERQWKLKVAEAVDRSLRWGLLDTMEGTSARYVSGPTAAGTARQIAAEEVMVPDAVADN